MTAYSGRRGPVFISLPLDVSAAQIAEQPIAGSVRSSFDVDAEACHRALELLEAAERPLVIAGAGTREATSRRALRRLAEHLRAPVCVTTKGKGVFPEDHPLYLGLLGFGGHASVVEYLEQGADVLLAIGTGLNDFTTNAWTPKLRATRAFLQIDIDSAQLGKNYPIDLGLVGPADAVVGRMLEHRAETRTPRSDTPSRIRYEDPQPSAKGMLTTADVVLAMNEVLPADALVTADMGEHLAFALHFYRVRANGDFFTALGFGSMGSGIVSAIGWQLGMPHRRTYAICGDGGMLMFGGELATAVQHKAATTFLVINDSRLNMVHHGLRDQYGSSPDLSTQLIDFAKMAQSMGAKGTIVTTRDQLIDALRLTADVPHVLDVRIDPDVRLGASQRVAGLRQFASGGS